MFAVCEDRAGGACGGGGMGGEDGGFVASWPGVRPVSSWEMGEAECTELTRCEIGIYDHVILHHGLGSWIVMSHTLPMAPFILTVCTYGRI